MIFATQSGGQVQLHSPAAKRYRPPLDHSVKRFARAETFERYLGLGYTIKEIANIFGLSQRTINYALKLLRDERERRAAEGIDPLPLLGT